MRLPGECACADVKWMNFRTFILFTQFTSTVTDLQIDVEDVITHKKRRINGCAESIYVYITIALCVRDQWWSSHSRCTDLQRINSLVIIHYPRGTWRSVVWDLTKRFAHDGRMSTLQYLLYGFYTEWITLL